MCVENEGMKPRVSDFAVAEDSGESRVRIRSRIDLVSLKADGKRKSAFRAALGQAVKTATKGIYVHDAEVTLVWYIEERRRYQTHIVADLDNVMKPTLDAITGPEGILIDDNQIQSIKASWMNPAAFGTGFDLTFEPLSIDEYLAREGLSFVEFSADRCYFLPGSIKGSEHLFVGAYREAVKAYQRQLDAGIAEEVARMVLPIARPFPRARLSRFSVRGENHFHDGANTQS